MSSAFIHSTVLLDICCAPNTVVGVKATAVHENLGSYPHEIYILVKREAVIFFVGFSALLKNAKGLLHDY